MVPDNNREHRLYAATRDGGAQLLDLHPAFLTASHAINTLRPGVYEGLRTFERSKFFGLKSHLDRLRDSIEGFEVALSYDEDLLVSALHGVAVDSAQAFDSEARIRVDVCAETAAAFGGETNIVFATSAYRGLPEHVQRDGAYLRTACGLARPDPRVKTSNFIPLREAWIEAHGDHEAYEHLMLNPDGALLEGTQSNVCLVRDGAIYGAPHGILPGVTLRTVLFLAREAGIDVREEFVPFGELGSFDEAFMTTSVRSVVPVSRIDEHRFPPAGPVTAQLAELYDAFSAKDAVLAANNRDATY